MPTSWSFLYKQPPFDYHIGDPQKEKEKISKKQQNSLKLPTTTPSYLFLLCHHSPHSVSLQLHLLLTRIDMQSLTCMPLSTSSSYSSYTFLKPNHNPLLGATSRPCLTLKKRACFNTRALLSSTKESVLKHFNERRALKIISGLHNFNKDNVASVLTAADKGGATHVDIACDPELVKMAISLTSCPVCVSSVDPATFPAAVEAGALMVEIGNYDSFYEKGIVFTPQQILGLTKETRRILPSVTLSVTVPHTLSLPDQVKLAELLEQEGVDIIQTEGGKCSNPTKSGVQGLIEKATPTLAAAYSISRAVKIPVMCSSGLSAVTAPMAITAGASGVGVGSAVNRLNDVVAMIAEVRSIATSLHTSSSQIRTTHGVETHRQ